MSVPVATERKSFLPVRLQPTGVVGFDTKISMPSVSENNNKLSLTVGNRVLVNGLKIGTLRYIGKVQFAQGLFCGVELDQPDGKHDGQVKDTRYFQCAPNHGIFVPRDKVVLAPRIRASSSQRPISRLKPPTLTRSITLSSAINKIEESKPIGLPDIVPNSYSQPVITNEPIEIIVFTEQPKDEIIESKIEPLSIDEPVEADFTDSVSLILHQLQQEQPTETRCSSVTISEEDSDDNDELDNESIIESIIDEQLDKTRHSSTSSVFLPIDLTKYVQTDLSFHSNDNISFKKVELSNERKFLSDSSTSINKLKINNKDEHLNINKKNPIIQPVKKNITPRPITITAKRSNTSAIPRAPLITPSKKGPIARTKLNSAHSVTSLISRSKQSLSLSSSSSQSDLASINKSSNSKQASDTTQDISQSIDVPSASSENKTCDNLNTLDQQLTTQKNINQSLETNNERLKKYYQHLLNQFDLMHIFSQYYTNENEQIKEQHRLQLSKVQTTKHRLKTSIEQLQTSHKNELSALDKEYQVRIETLNKTHEQQLNEHQQKTNHLLQEKTALESRCLVLQEKVDGFLTEMANSEHADVLLCHVETLEKDRTSLQTVLEFKNKEITQLRTKLHEIEIKLNDETVLRKRVDAAEHRNQDLSCLLRERQLTEKAAVIERDRLKEQVAQLDRDNCQLKFENETLHYRLRERSLSVSTPSDNPIILLPKLITNPRPKGIVRKRARSLPLMTIITHENERLTRSLYS